MRSWGIVPIACAVLAAVPWRIAAQAPGEQQHSLVGCYAGTGLEPRYGSTGSELTLLIDSVPPPFRPNSSMTAAWLLGWGGPRWDMWGWWRTSGDSIVVEVFDTYPQTHYGLRRTADGFEGHRITYSDIVPPHRPGEPDPPTSWAHPVSLRRSPCPRAPIHPDDRHRASPPDSTAKPSSS
jgi:hypothetical protein